KLAGRPPCRHVRYVALFGCQVAGHEVDRLGEVLPRAGHTLHVRLTAEFAFGADLARDARHLGGERAQLVDHRVDRRLQLEDLALDVEGTLLTHVAIGHRYAD